MSSAMNGNCEVKIMSEEYHIARVKNKLGMIIRKLIDSSSKYNKLAENITACMLIAWLSPDPQSPGLRLQSHRF